MTGNRKASLFSAWAIRGYRLFAGSRGAVRGCVLPTRERRLRPSERSARAIPRFQSRLEQSTLRSWYAAMLNLTQDHLDRYASMGDYAKAKERIFLNAGTRVVNRDDAWSRAMAGGARTFSFGLDLPRGADEWGLDRARTHLRRGDDDLIALDDMAMKGLHNAANAMAAHALLSAIGVPREPLARALREFRGLPHRVEQVAEAGGVRFYDDSKGTNVGATVAALEGFRHPVVLIAGGDGKGQDFKPLPNAVRRHTRAVVLIGRDAPAIGKGLAGAGVPLGRA